MLNLVKTALRIVGNAFDAEIALLIVACIEEMRGLGVIVEIPDGSDIPTSSQVQTAIIAYCKWQFGDADNKADFEAIYHTKLAQLKTMTNYTEWEA